MAAPGEPINVADYERLAAEVLDPGAHGYFAGGAGDERTLRENVAAFARWRLRPRVLVDVSEVTTGTTVLGEPVAMPILVAPVAFQRLAHPDGEAGMARAAASAGTVMCLSTLATARPGEVASAAPDARLWFQLYCFRDRGVTRALLSEAEEAGIRAVAVTVDAPRPGKRERDLRSGFQLPAELSVPSVAQATGAEGPISVADVLGLVDPALGWEDLEALVIGLEPARARQGRDDGRGRGAGRGSGRGWGDRLQPRRAPARRSRGHRRRAWARWPRRSETGSRC